jgi:hypothetical protein
MGAVAYAYVPFPYLERADLHCGARFEGTKWRLLQGMSLNLTVLV